MTNSGNDTPNENPSDSDPVNDSTGDVSSIDGATRNDSDATDDAAISALLGSLAPLTMPEAVHQRILSSLAAEPNPYAAPAPVGDPVGDPAVDAPVGAAAVEPTNIASRRKNKNRWLVAVAGVAAAGVIGVSLSSSLFSTDGGNVVPTAAVVPMSASGMVYDKASLVSQVSSVLPTWTTAATNYDGVVELQPPDADDGSAGDDLGDTATIEEFDELTGSATASASPDPDESLMAETKPGQDPVMVNKKVLDQVNDCVQLVDQRRPIHVDIASYRGGPTAAAEPVAVFALDGDDEQIEVYVVSVRCSRENPAMVREHVTVSAP